jgi:hypothetical protein
MAASDEEVGSTAAAAVAELLSPDAVGPAALEAVQLVADLVRRRKCAAPARVVESLLAMRLRDVPRPEPDAAGKGKAPPKKKRKKKKGQLEKDLAEADAGPDPREQAALQSRLLEVGWGRARLYGPCCGAGLWAVSAGAACGGRRAGCRAPLQSCGGRRRRPRAAPAIDALPLLRPHGWPHSSPSQTTAPFPPPNCTCHHQALFETFFRVLKHCSATLVASQQQQQQQEQDGGDDGGGSGTHGAALDCPWPASKVAARFPLLAPVMAGLGRYSHLISVDYFNDLAAVLQEVRDHRGGCAVWICSVDLQCGSGPRSRDLGL